MWRLDRDPETEQVDFRRLLEEGTPHGQPVLLFPSAARVEPAPACAIPESIVRRDVPPLRPGLTLHTACFRGSPGHALAFYEAREPDGDEAWRVIQLYDVAFETVGRTERAPERWPSNVYANDFVVLAVLTLPELPSPVFVIGEPCTGFVLYSFLESGRLARVTVPFVTTAPSVGCSTH